MNVDERLDQLEEHVEDIDRKMAEQDERIGQLEATSEKFFSKVLRKFDGLEAKMGKMIKWVYRLLGVIIALLIIIAINSPSTATSIMSSASAVFKAV